MESDNAVLNSLKLESNPTIGNNTDSVLVIANDGTVKQVSPSSLSGLNPTTIQNLPLYDDKDELVGVPDYTPYRTSSGYLKYKVPNVTLMVTNGTSSSLTFDGEILLSGNSINKTVQISDNFIFQREDEEPYKENSSEKIYTNNEPLELTLESSESIVLEDIYGSDNNYSVSFDFWQFGGNTEGFTVFWDRKDSLGNIEQFNIEYEPFAQQQYGGGFYSTDKENWIIDIEFPSNSNIATGLNHIYRDTMEIINEFPLVPVTSFGTNRYRTTIPLSKVTESMTFSILADYNPNN